MIYELCSVSELADQVNAWCAEHGIAPANGQAGEAVTERNIRFYRTIGLLDAPESSGRGFGEKHFLQLIAIRLLQAQGLPLRRIRELLFGRTVAELREVQKHGLAESRRAFPANRLPMPAGDELWRVTPLDDDFMIVSRRGTTLSAAQREAILRALHSAPQKPKKRTA
ncbi:MAG: MerR family transcriptional regulator [Chthoniobacteraceae bacterium]